MSTNCGIIFIHDIPIFIHAQWKKSHKEGGRERRSIYQKKCDCPWLIRVRRLEGPVTLKGDRAVVFEPGMHVLQYPVEDHNPEIKASLFLMGTLPPN